MGKKVKIGKQRKDKYYRLAKEAGYRSRAAFKLIQLNKRFEFLQNSRALVDLCAAPGGWLQVARQNMPMSSLCIGMDLVPIKAVHNAITLQGDITTEKARQMIKKELQSWEADCVLHDGAPNVGLNWSHDAFQQNQLVLSALRLATQVLGKNGWFVTKIFRSKDYEALIGVFEKLFKRVHVWKPAASRLESAEIFVACEKYLKPVKVDPALLDPKAVFKDANIEPSAIKPQDLLQSHKKVKKVRAEGYAEGDTTLHHRLKASELIDSKDYLELLSNTNEVVLDIPLLTTSEHTTVEVLECLKDVKVCGPRELRSILAWRKKMRDLLIQQRLTDEANGEHNENEDAQEPEELTPEQQEAREIAEIDVLIANAKSEEKAVLKRKKRRMLKEKSKERVKKDLKMIIEGDKPDLPEQQDLFSLAQIKRARQLVAVADAPVPDIHDRDHLDDDDDDEESDEEMSDDGEMEHEEMEDDEEEQHPLIMNEDYGLNRDQRVEKRTEQWFDRDGLADLLDEDEDVAAVEKHIERMKTRKANKDLPTVSDEAVDAVAVSDGGELDAKGESAKVVDEAELSDEAESSDDETAQGAFDEEISDSDEDDYDSDDPTVAKRTKKTPRTKSGSTADFEIVPQGETATLEPKLKRRKLDPVLLAMGEQMIYSSKTRRDLEEFGWNRFTNNDEGLPDWFVDDERKHYRKQLPVTKAQMDEYRQRLREFNARPIKKVAEAKMRKRKKEASKQRLAKKRAQRIVDDPEMEQQEKVREMKKVYQKAATKKKDVAYKVVSKGKRGTGAKPKGPFKVVDKRLKKDNRKQKEETRTKQWKSKSTEAKRAAMEKNKRSRSGRKADKRTNRRAKRGKT